jgi:hypothetical protein
MEALKSEVLNSPCCQPSPLFDNIPTRVPKLSSVSVGGKELMPVIKIGFDNGAEYAFHNDDIQEMFLDWLTAVGVEHTDAVAGDYQDFIEEFSKSLVGDESQ